MQTPSNVEYTKALLNPNSKIFVTPQYKTFIKTKNYKNENPKILETSVKYLTEEFEVKDVDANKIFAENEFFHLRDSNEKVNQIYHEIKNLSKQREVLRQSSLLNRESKIKQKLLVSLKKGGKGFNQSESNFSKKFEKILAKDGSNFISKLLQKMKKMEVGIGLEFPENLQEEITRGYRELLQALTKQKVGKEVKVPDRVYHSFMLEDGLMLNFMENMNYQGKIEWYTQFYSLTADKKSKTVSMTKLKCNYELRTEQRIHEVKYFPEGNSLIITSVLPREDRNLIVQVFELTRNESNVHFEPVHKIKTDGRWSEFVRAGGVEYIVYTNDLLSDQQFKKLNIMSFEDTFVNPKVKPLIERMDVDIKVFKTCNLDNGFIIGEGPSNSIALINLAAKNVVAYYKDHKGEDSFIYLLASFSKTKNLLFVMHNSKDGAIISVFGLDASSNTLLLKQTLEFYTILKNHSMQSLASRYFQFQFNHSQNRLDIVDDYQKTFFRFKFNQQSQLVQDGDAIKLQYETKDCLPTFIMTRIDGDLYFLQYFTLSTYLKSYYFED